MALRVVGVVIAVLLLVVGLSLVILRTDFGGERVRRLIVSRVNQQIQGTLDIKRLSFGEGKVVLWGVALRDPEGQVVGQVARAELDFAMSRLLHQEIRVTAVVIETPILAVVTDDDGSNLARATAPRKKPAKKPPTPKKKTTREGWVLRIDRLELTHGDLSKAVRTVDQLDTKVHVSALGVVASVRYATGNGALDLRLHLQGESQQVPVGPLRLEAQLGAHGDEYRFDVDGDLLAGHLKAHGSVDSQHLEAADASVALAIPQQELAAYKWGPLRIDGQAHPGTQPKLDVLLAVPGVELAIEDRGSEAFGIKGRLTVADLDLIGRATAALIGGAVPDRGGRGEVTFDVEKPSLSAAVGFGGQAKGAFESLRFGPNVITRLTFAGQAAALTSRPGRASFDLAIASISAGASRLRGLTLSANVREQELSASFAIAEPARVELALAGRLDDDRHGFSLSSLTCAYPGTRWSSEGVARARFDDKELSLSKLRMASQGQALAVDAASRGDDLDAHLALTALRLDRLPTILIDPALRLDGELNADVKANGPADDRKVVAQVELRQGRYQAFSKIDAKARATLEDDEIDGTIAVDSPFLTGNAALKLPTDPLIPGAPLVLKLDVKHLDLEQLLRGAQGRAAGGGRLNLKLLLDGSADDPKLDLTVEGFDLSVSKLSLSKPANVGNEGDSSKPKAVAGKTVEGDSPASKAVAAKAVAAKVVADNPVGGKQIDLGHAHIHVTYADEAARAEVDFASSHGGTLVVDAGCHVDLSYPKVTHRMAVPKLPVHGKVVARDLDVSWLAQFNPRVESLGGQVTADARLAGTVGDPQFIGDVHWKNGQAVAKVPPPPLPTPKATVVPGAGSHSAR
ncbi:MAG: hypothetical protein JWM82_2837 [Myxococcales bacterium]|nr:hypothetical protein [Myxococcales bacterium]